MKQILQKFLSLGITPEMDEEEKIAVRAAVLANLGAFGSYFVNGIYVYFFDIDILLGVDIIACLGLSFCFYLFYIHKNFLAKILMNVIAIGLVIISHDMVRTNYEMYFFIGVINPFIVFAPKDYKKAFFVALCVSALIVLQILIGKEHLHPFLNVPDMNIAMMLFTVFVYLSFVMALGRLYTKKIQDEVEKKQKEIVHSSNIYSLGEMVGGVAFEINTPLQILTSNVESIKRQISTPDFDRHKVQEQIQTMNKTIDKMATLINGIRKLTRNSVNDPVTDFTLNEVIESVRSVCERRLAFKGVDLSVQVDKNLKIKSQVGQVSQVLLNLLNNSIEASYPVAEKWIRIESEVINDQIQLKVTDSGQPIEPEIAEKMMGLSLSTKKNGRGMGMGLNISQGIMEKLGGRLVYNSQCSNTQFIMEFPANISV